LLLPRIRRTLKCARCGLRYPVKDAQCPHCAQLSDREVERLRQRIADEHRGNANLGRLFLYIAVLLLLAILLFSL
jgi:hypothetical protein